MALGIRRAALLKWGLVFVTTALLSPLFLVAVDRWFQGVGVAWLLIAAFGLWAVMFRPRMLEWAFPALGVGLLASAFVLGGG